VGLVVLAEVSQLAVPACVVRPGSVHTLRGGLLRLACFEVSLLAHAFGVVVCEPVGTPRDEPATAHQRDLRLALPVELDNLENSFRSADFIIGLSRVRSICDLTPRIFCLTLLARKVFSVGLLEWTFGGVRPRVRF